MTTAPATPVRLEVLVRADCPNRAMALRVAEKAVAETGVPVELEVVELETETQAAELRFLGSPSVRVGGLDVEPASNDRTDYTLASRLYRCDRGLQGWPHGSWISSALLLASVQSGPDSSGAFGRSSATSP